MRYLEAELVTVRKNLARLKEGKFKSSLVIYSRINIFINSSVFSGSSTSGSSCTPRQVYRDLGHARLELEGGVHFRFEERLGMGDTMGKVVHRPGGEKGVKHCDQVGQLKWVGSFSTYLRQGQITYSSMVRSITWPCVSRLQTVVGVSEPCHGKTLCWLLPLNSLADRAQYSHGLKCTSIVNQDISSKARLWVKCACLCWGQEQ